jgi:DNA mismatch repair protein MutL
LLPLTCEAEPFSLHGLIGAPTLNRSTSGAIYAYINGRYVRDRMVQHAIMDGYRSLLAKGRYPVVVLFLDLPPEMVDVNVHPSKYEVRFRDQRAVHDFITASLRDALRRIHTVAEPTGSFEPVSSAMRSPVSYPVDSGRTALLPPTPASAPSELPALSSLPRLAESVPDYVAADAPMTSPVSAGRFAAMTVLGQYHNSYLLCQEGDDLLLIDQHAAHERIGYERLRRQFYGNGIVRQGLLFPVVLELDFRAAAQLAQQRDELSRFGFDVEPFGGNAFVLKGVPQLLSESAAELLLRDVCAELDSLGSSSLLAEHFDHLLMTMACHGAVRANQALGLSQMRALLADLDQVDFGGHCPHGRPVLHRFTLAEVGRLFRRG